MSNQGALATALLLCLVTSLSACLSGGAGPRSETRSAGSRGPLALPDIPHTRSVLKNGLTLIVHEDHEAPIVAVSVWYHVGSKDEKEGRTGFAHLFEHLMFNGSEHHDDDYFKPFDHVGATVVSGTTSRDVTNYFQTVPATALDMALWMESDRMGHLLGAIDRDKLDEQRGVVENEKRDRENGPYGKVFPQIAEITYPAGHPYAHPVTGSIEDLEAATVEDVREWFESHYGAANAVLVVAGDVETAVVQAKVEEYFGDISPGPPLARPTSWVARRAGETRTVMRERVAQARLYKVWNIPEIGHQDVASLMLASDALSSGKNSRLHQRLVYQDQIATDVTSVVSPHELGGQLIIWATAQPGGDLAQVERRLDEELARFLAEGPTRTELQRARAGHRAGLLRRLERLGGLGSRSDLLAASEVHHGDPDAWKVQARRIQQATSASVRAAAREWLREGAHVVEVHPVPRYQAAERGVDRSGGVPEVSEFPAGRFPNRETAALPSGMKVILARRPTVPLVELRLMLDAGFAADQFGKPGTAQLAMSMLDEGTQERTALQIADQLERLGATLGAACNLDVSLIAMSALAENLDASLELFADVILHPVFPEADFARLQRQQLAAIQREKVEPRAVALRVIPGLLFGAGHAYGQPLTGTGTEGSVRRITREELKAFHRTWFKPNNATLVVVGDVSMEALLPRLRRHFGEWQPGRIPEKALGRVERTPASAVHLVDRPGSEHSIIVAGQVMPPKDHPDDLAIEAVNDILGGSFTGRLNMNLREDKHWAYGASSVVVPATGPRPFLVWTSVQSDKTGASMAEIAGELRAIVGDHPPSPQEIVGFKDRSTLTLPGRWVTNAAVAADIAHVVRFGLPENHWETYADTVRRLTLPAVARAAKSHLNLENTVWVVVGDRARIAPQIRELGMGELRLTDADGNLLETWTP